MEGPNRRRHLGLAVGSAMTASMPEAVARELTEARAQLEALKAAAVRTAEQCAQECESVASECEALRGPIGGKYRARGARECAERIRTKAVVANVQDACCEEHERGIADASEPCTDFTNAEDVLVWLSGFGGGRGQPSAEKVREAIDFARANIADRINTAGAVAHALRAGVSIGFGPCDLGVRVEVRGLPGAPIVVDATSVSHALELALDQARARVKHEAV